MEEKKEDQFCEIEAGFRLRLLLIATKTPGLKLAAFLKITRTSVNRWIRLIYKIPLIQIKEILTFFEQRHIIISEKWLLYGEGSLPTEISSELLSKESSKKESIEKRAKEILKAEKERKKTIICYPFPRKLDIKNYILLKTNECPPISLYLENEKIFAGKRIKNVEKLHKYQNKHLLIEKTDKTVFLGCLISISKQRKNFTFKVKDGACLYVEKQDIKAFAEVKYIVNEDAN